MRATLQRRYGGPDEITIGERALPRVGTNEVLVRVRAASVNAADWFILTGTPWPIRMMTGLLRPTGDCLGVDFAGEVVSVGAAVTRVRAGESVFGEARGTFAEYVRVPEARLARMPDGASFEQMSTLPVAGCTALQGLRDAARVQPGDRVLVNGASGGVGSFAVQIADVLGAEVTAVCSARNASRARELGATHVIDYGREDFTATDDRYDAIFDLAGRAPLRRCLAILRPRGRYVASTGRIRRLLEAAIASIVPRSRVTVLAGGAKPADLEALASLVERGLITPRIEHTFPLDQISDALRLQGTGHAQGKSVVVL